MAIRCPSCGRDNRDAANFCVGCGQQGLLQLVAQAAPPPHYRPTPVPPSLPQPPLPGALVPNLSAPVAPQQAQPLGQPGQQPLASPSQAPVPQASARAQQGVLVEGVVETYNENEVLPPTNYSWVFTKLALGLVVVPFALSFLLSLGMVVIVVVILGGMVAVAVLGVLGGILGLMGKLIRLFLPRRRAVDQRLTQLSLGVEDAQQTLHRVVLYGDHIGGQLRQGDVIEVYGKQRRNGVIHARKVVLVGRQFARGQVLRVEVKSRRSLPPVIVPIVLWGIVVAVWAVLWGPTFLNALH